MYKNMSDTSPVVTSMPQKQKTAVVNKLCQEKLLNKIVILEKETKQLQ